RGEVVDLAVEDGDVAARRRPHRLVAERREVENREPAEAERNAGAPVCPHAAVVGPAMHDRLDHPARALLERVGCEPAARQQTGYATHRGGALSCAARSAVSRTRSRTTADATLRAPAGVRWKKS